jgi:hypothetical protein
MGRRRPGVCLRQPDEWSPGGVRSPTRGSCGAGDGSVPGRGRRVPGGRAAGPGRRGLQGRWRGCGRSGSSRRTEAAAWALIGHRIRIVRGGQGQGADGGELGQAVDIHGDVRRAFPGPGRLAGWRGSRGCSPARSRTSGRWATAADGPARRARLRGLPREQALAELKQLRGIGDFSAELVLLRPGAGDPDHLPVHEPRACAAGRRSPTTSTSHPRPRMAGAPRSGLAPPTGPGSCSCPGPAGDETGEIGGTRNVGTRQT